MAKRCALVKLLRGPIARPTRGSTPTALRELHITRRRGISMDRTYTLFRGEPAPATLRELRLHFVPIIVAPLHLSNRITTLELDGSVVVSVEEILRILQACPSLRVLELGLLDLSVPLLAVLKRYPRIDLLYLEHFQLRLVDEFFTRILLLTLRFPNVVTRNLPIQVENHDDERMLDFLTGPSAYLTAVLHRIISTADRIELRFETRQFVVKAAGLSVNWTVDGLDQEQ
ncbi:hypothetical protein FRB90_001482, partial [Tulasnella sp. 427]